MKYLPHSWRASSLPLLVQPHSPIDAVLDVLIIYLIHEIVNRLFAVVGKLAGGVFAAHRKVIRGVGVDGKKYLFGWVARKLISVVDC